MLDEPLAYLDILSQKAVLNDLRAIATSQRKPIGVVLSSQQLYEIESMSDRLIVIDDGAVKFSDKTIKLQINLKHKIVELKIDGRSLREVEFALSALGLLDVSPSEMGYIARFHLDTNIDDIVDILSAAFQDKMLYFRDISKSCRRYFDIGLKSDE